MKTTEDKLKELIKKLDFGDVRVLGAGILLLLLPIIFLAFLSGSGGKKRAVVIDQGRLEQMAARKNVFNFGLKQAESAIKTNKETVKTGSGTWFSKKTPEQAIADELRYAMQIIERSKPDYRFPSDFTSAQKQAYLAEHNESLTSGRGALEMGNYSEAERLLKAAYEEGTGNPFLMAYAMGELCSLYEKIGDLKALEGAFKLYMEAIGKMPEGFGGGNLGAAVRNAFMSLKTLRESVASGRASSYVAQDQITSSMPILPSDIEPGIIKTLKTFPAKFD